MGTIEYGSPQTLTFDYNQDATAKLFNSVNFKLTPTGIYEGFTLTRISNSFITVSTGTCFIHDSNTKTGTRISTGSSEQVQVTSATPYIILRFAWIDSPNNYLDILAVSYENLGSDDLIVGRCIYDDSGTTLLSNFDYTRRSIQYTDKIKTENAYLRVTPTEPYSKKFIVSSGILNSSKGNLLISGGAFPAADLPDTENGRNDIVYVDENGLIKVQLGTDASTPVTPRYGNKKVIAEIRRGASRTSIRGHEIIQIISSFDSTPITSDLSLIDSGNFYASSNVEDAFQEIAESDYTFSGIKTFNGGLLAKASQIITGAVGENIQTLKKSNGDVIQYNDQNGKLINTVGSEIAFLDQYSKYTTDKLDSALNQIAGEDMTIGGIKTFSSTVQGNISGYSSTALYAMNFDLVIDSNEKLAVWIANASPYEKVLIKKGTWSAPSGSKLTLTTTKVVVAEPGGVLYFSNILTGYFCFGYSSTPISNQQSYSMYGVTISANNISGYYMSAFANCINLYNCGVNAGTSIGGINLKGFYNCVNLVNCTSTTSGSGEVLAYSKCTDLINCYAKSAVYTSDSKAIGFSGCDKVANCYTVVETLGLSNTFAIGFSSCIFVSNCSLYASKSGGGTTFGYSLCKKCYQNNSRGAETAYIQSYADTALAYTCADTPNGGFNSNDSSIT